MALAARRSTHPMWATIQRSYLRPEQVLKRFNLYEAPVEISTLAANLGLRVVPWDYADDHVSGQISYDGESAPIVYVHSRQSHVRQRFTVAHEIGHAVLHLREGVPMDLPRDTNFEARGNRIEAQANGYAAALLMPFGLLSHWGPQYAWDTDLLASLFMVSRTAMEIRLNRLYQ